MTTLNLNVGDAIPELTIEPVTRHTLALFAGASGDHHPIHLDLDFARAAGFPDVFAHGMLGMAWLGRCLTDWQPQGNLESFRVRFGGITQLGHELRCRGHIVELLEVEGRRVAKLNIEAVNQYDEVKIAGDAVLVF